MKIDLGKLGVDLPAKGKARREHLQRIYDARRREKKNNLKKRKNTPVQEEALVQAESVHVEPVQAAVQTEAVQAEFVQAAVQTEAVQAESARAAVQTDAAQAEPVQAACQTNVTMMPDSNHSNLCVMCLFGAMQRTRVSPNANPCVEKALSASCRKYWQRGYLELESLTHEVYSLSGLPSRSCMWIYSIWI